MARTRTVGCEQQGKRSAEDGAIACIIGFLFQDYAPQPI